MVEQQVAKNVVPIMAVGLTDPAAAKIATDSITGMKRFREAAVAYKQSIGNTTDPSGLKP